MRWIAVVVPVVLLMAVPLACGRADVELPQELCGRWITDDALYRGRYLELSNEELRFGNCDMALDVFEIVQIQMSGEGANARYDITYLDVNGDESIFSFDYLIQHAVIRFINTPGRRWKKAPQGIVEK